MKSKIYSGKQIKMNIKEQVWIPAIWLSVFFWLSCSRTADDGQLVWHELHLRSDPDPL